MGVVTGVNEERDEERRKVGQRIAISRLKVSRAISFRFSHTILIACTTRRSVLMDCPPALLYTTTDSTTIIVGTASPSRISHDRSADTDNLLSSAADVLEF